MSIGELFRKQNPLGTLQARMEAYKNDPAFANYKRVLEATAITTDQAAAASVEFQHGKMVGDAISNAVPITGMATARMRMLQDGQLKLDIGADGGASGDKKIGHVIDPGRVEDVYRY